MAKKGKRVRPDTLWKEEALLMRNFVAKWMEVFNKPKVEKNKKKYSRKTKHKGNFTHE